MVAINLRSNAYRAEVDNIDKDGWHQLMQRFTDAVIHQTWSFGAARWGEDNLSHLVLKRNGETVAAAQVVLAKLPIIGAGIGHIKFGPMWQLRGQQPSFDTYRQIISALRKEYAERRGLLLRIKPWEPSDEDASVLRSLREAEGFRWQQHLPHYKTFILDLSHTIEELHKGLKLEWRRNLKKAQRRGQLEISEVKGSDGVETFLHLYKEMHTRKGFYDTSEVNIFADFYADLPIALKPEILICRYQDKAIASIVISSIGDRGFYLFSATSEQGRALGASYLLMWSAVMRLKERGCRWYDLVGSYPTTGSPSQPPGYRQFKKGLVGRCGHEMHMGDFDACYKLSSLITVKAAHGLQYAYRNIRHRLKARKDASADA
jgi:hypothetical protein